MDPDLVRTSCSPTKKYMFDSSHSHMNEASYALFFCESLFFMKQVLVRGSEKCSSVQVCIRASEKRCSVVVHPCKCKAFIGGSESACINTCEHDPSLSPGLSQ